MKSIVPQKEEEFVCRSLVWYALVMGGVVGALFSAITLSEQPLSVGDVAVSLQALILALALWVAGSEFGFKRRSARKKERALELEGALFMMEDVDAVHTAVMKLQNFAAESSRHHSQSRHFDELASRRAFYAELDDCFNSDKDGSAARVLASVNQYAANFGGAGALSVVNLAHQIYKVGACLNDIRADYMSPSAVSDNAAYADLHPVLHDTLEDLRQACARAMELFAEKIGNAAHQS